MSEQTLTKIGESSDKPEAVAATEEEKQLQTVHLTNSDSSDESKAAEGFTLAMDANKVDGEEDEENEAKEETTKIKAASKQGSSSKAEEE